jgi:hypothetical protein
VRAVKVAHHGSRGAQEPGAWDAHVRSRADQTWAIIAPFRHGSVTLPDVEVLRDLHGRGVRLAICDARPVRARARDARWRLDRSVDEVCAGPLIAITWTATGACTAVRGRRAAVYVA